MNQGFIEQTAHDYGLPVEVVERIYKLYPNNFYQELENLISNRIFNNQNEK